MKRPLCVKLQAGLATALTLLLTTSAAWAERNPNTGIAPPQSSPYGQTYGEWSGAWWRWAYSFPAGEDQNPVQDPTGALAGLGQSGPVWFLAGSFGQTITRTATVPAGKALFFPIINTAWINIPELATIPGRTNNARLRSRSSHPSSTTPTTSHARSTGWRWQTLKATGR